MHTTNLRKVGGSVITTGHAFVLVPTLRVGTPPWTLRVLIRPLECRPSRERHAAERLRMHSHAERGNETNNFWPAATPTYGAPLISPLFQEKRYPATASRVAGSTTLTARVPPRMGTTRQDRSLIFILAQRVKEIETAQGESIEPYRRGPAHTEGLYLDQSDQFHGPGFGEPAVYRISVAGRLDARAAEVIGDAEIEAPSPGATNLLLRVKDQASLSGALDALYGQHLVILSVELLSRP